MIRLTGSIRWKLVACFLATHLCYECRADDLQLATGAVGSYLSLRELQTTGSVLHVVAHPDDEDGGMLAYCARGLGVRTMLFSLTRGEGGANLISSHFFDELGALRTLEHRKAANYYGIELFYSRAADYGYSKTIEEALQQWNNGLPLLEDLVEVIRREQPTILLSRFAGDPRDGHGHHQMAGLLSRRAFDAAADPKQFPDQITRGLRPWQIKKLYVRSGSPWRTPKDGEWTIALPVGMYDPVVGKSPAQIARFGLGFQRSQGISGHASEAGPKNSYYRLVKHVGVETLPENETSLFEGIDISWSGLIASTDDSSKQWKSELAGIDSSLTGTLENWDPRHPDITARALVEIQKRILKLQGQPLPDDARSYVNRLSEKLNDPIVMNAGLTMESWVTDLEGEPINHAIPGEELKATIRIANQGEIDVKVFSLHVGTPQGKKQLTLPEHVLRAGTVLEVTENFQIDPSTPISLPHWSRDDISRPLYEISSNGRQRAEPFYALRSNAKVILHDTAFDMGGSLQTRRRDPEFGNVRYPVAIVDNKSIRFGLSKTIVPKGKQTFTSSVNVRNLSKRKNTATLRIELPEGWSCEPKQHDLTFEREDEESIRTFEISLPESVEEKLYAINAVIESESAEIRQGFETVTARDLSRMNIYHDAVQHVQVVDVQLLGEPNVGYISGSGDSVAESLAPLGIAPTILSKTDLAIGDLSRFDVILVGVRAYAVREDVRAHNSRLLAYVKQGGVLIVQYQTPEFDYNFGPYPYAMGRGPEEVSEELAPVSILQPKHPLFQTPNTITVQDFNGWFEQRGSKFWKSWDEKYTPLLECHDTGQAPQRGGQLIAQYGNGVYVYSAYAWYRQLPQGVPGAYRLFGNLLSLPKTNLVK